MDTMNEQGFIGQDILVGIGKSATKCKFRSRPSGVGVAMSEESLVLFLVRLDERISMAPPSVNWRENERPLWGIQGSFFNGFHIAKIFSQKLLILNNSL